MNWGKSIILVFVIFALFIATLVTVCVRQDISLVSKNYYAEELVYQDEIDRLNNAARLKSQPSVRISGEFVEVEFEKFDEVQKGTLILTRPSDSRYDVSFTITPGSDTVQRYGLKGLPRGRYHASLRWTMNDVEFLSNYDVSL